MSPYIRRESRELLDPHFGGALECTKLELYRRRVADYEDQKIADNGDAYE